uniref:Uncharacterized protein n=1 Tax=Manihot esculenta TaxID=3983 RepID=A0A2C9UIU2_MANES
MSQLSTLTRMFLFCTARSNPVSLTKSNLKRNRTIERKFSPRNTIRKSVIKDLCFPK